VPWPEQEPLFEIMNDAQLGRLLGSGKEAEVFEWGPRVVKLYRSSASKGSAFREAAGLALAESFGLPVPSVSGVRQIEDRWGFVITRAGGPSFAEAIGREPGLTRTYLKQMARLQSRVHTHPGTQFASLRARLAANIQRAEGLTAKRRHVLRDSLAEMPEPDRLCHGDFHPGNIMGPPGQEVLVDWLDARQGDPAVDVCRTYVLMRPSAPELASCYVDIYVADCGESRERIFRGLPIVAAARLAEGVSGAVLTEMIEAGR
jgi:aminoglycoside phosphotransferase (APT) family kinase protein